MGRQYGHMARPFDLDGQQHNGNEHSCGKLWQASHHSACVPHHAAGMLVKHACRDCSDLLLEFEDDLVSTPVPVMCICCALLQAEPWLHA